MVYINASQLYSLHDASESELSLDMIIRLLQREKKINIVQAESPRYHCNRGILFEQVFHYIIQKEGGGDFDRKRKFISDNVICMPDGVSDEKRIIYEFKCPEELSPGDSIPERYVDQVRIAMFLADKKKHYRGCYREAVIRVTKTQPKNALHAGVVYINNVEETNISAALFKYYLGNEPQRTVLNNFIVSFDMNNIDEGKPHIYFYVKGMKEVFEDSLKDGYIKGLMKKISHFCTITDRAVEIVKKKENLESLTYFNLSSLILEALAEAKSHTDM